MDALTAQLQDLSVSLSSVSERLKKIENRQNGGDVGPVEPNVHVEQPDQPANANEDIHSAYQAIKAALASTRIPPSLTVPTDKTGIRKSDQAVHNVITRTSKFAETVIKIIQVPGLTSEQRLGDILTVTTALTCFLQEETAALVVQGTFDDGVAKFFRSLQRSNNFTPESLENLRAAASIAAVYRPNQGQTQRGTGFRGGSGGGYRGHFRGFRRRGFGRGQGSYNNTAAHNGHGVEEST